MIACACISLNFAQNAHFFLFFILQKLFCAFFFFVKLQLIMTLYIQTLALAYIHEYIIFIVLNVIAQITIVFIFLQKENGNSGNLLLFICSIILFFSFFYTLPCFCHVFSLYFHNFSCLSFSTVSRFFAMFLAKFIVCWILIVQSARSYCIAPFRHIIVIKFLFLLVKIVSKETIFLFSLCLCCILFYFQLVCGFYFLIILNVIYLQTYIVI